MRRSDVLLAILSGILLALSFPRFGHPAVGWIALTPLILAVAEDGSRSRAVLLGLISGLIYFGGTVYWIAYVMIVYGNLPGPVGVSLTAGFIAYLALFPGFFAGTLRHLVRSFGTTALMAAPLIWVTSELGRAYIVTGFPWVLLGYSQASVLAAAQSASLVGVFGLSGIVAGVSAAIATLGLAASGRTRMRGSALAGPVMMLLLAVGLAGWGAARVARSELTRMGTPIRVGLVQANVDQATKWNPVLRASILQDYLRLTRQAVEQRAGLVVWPESSTPFMLEEDRADGEQVRLLARASRVPILLGSDQIDRTGGLRYYNAAFLVGQTGDIVGVYRKMHLVPWGEYVPLRQWLFFVQPIVETVSDFSKGDRVVLLSAGGHPVSTAICYEIVYPDLVRQAVVQGSELLTTITNDAWFGPTSAPYQHFEQASMRAIEEGRYLVRSANTGVSGIVDPYGRVLARTEIYRPAVVVGDARFVTARTVYSRTGDVFAYVCVLCTAVLLVSTWRRRV